ncbi:CdaR family transcriptional regulator [Paenibacillus xerothermodurans]|uniref:Transcriptional regulator n=1 Tax=Paenibacillus xerothermodurans TaxID=1977292 RepID=A0A2W1NAE3_PAEXE|nr:sugar diacid recognition domain-containing protein [Paenibacillus xerothermodurans]PZE20151.1 hypothetical protein CBW46_014770 [Paenibacillus xerothermodurans]
MLTTDLAETIVQETMTRLRRNINMMDENGYIIASGDSTRLGELHEGAREAIRTGRPLIIDRENEAKWKGSVSGINVPVMFRGDVVGVIGITGDPAEVVEFGEIVKMTTELMLQQSFMISQGEWQQRTKEMIMEELLKAQPDFTKVDDRLHLLQLTLQPPFEALVLQTETRSFFDNRRLLRLIEDSLGEKVLMSVGSYERIFILLTGLTESQAEHTRGMLQQTLAHSGFNVRIGYTSAAPTRIDIPAAFSEAGLALLFGDKKSPLVSYQGLEPQAIVHLSDDDHKRRFAARILSGVSEQLVGTLQVFFDSGLNIQSAAQALYIHRNTLIYRLKRIRELTGCDPQLFQDAAALQMAVWIVAQGHGSKPHRGRQQ